MRPVEDLITRDAVMLRYHPDHVRLAWIHAAYLAAFAFFGWKYILQLALQPFRYQLGNQSALRILLLSMQDPDAAPRVVSVPHRLREWRTYPADVLPLTVAEMDFALATPVAEALREAVDRSDAGYALAVPDLGKALADFAASRWNWDINPMSVTAVTDVGVGVVELLWVLTSPGDAVVISPPVYPPFFDWVPEAGARLLEVPLAHTAAG